MATDLARLMHDTTRSARTDLVSRPRPATASMALSAARDEVVVLRRAQDNVLRPARDNALGRRRAVIGAVSGQQYALAAPCNPSSGRSQCDLRPAAVINQNKSIESIDEGFNAANHDGMGAFVTSLGSRPPSPPV